MELDFLAEREFRLLILMCVLLGVCAWVSTKLSLDAGGASCIWISNGLISAFILTVPAGWKKHFFIAGEVVNTGVDLAFGDPLIPALWFALCSCAEVLIAVLPLRHFAVRADVSNRRAMCRIAYFAVFLGPLTGALLGAPAIAMQQARPWPEVLRLWFLSSSLGVAASLPFVLFLATRDGRRRTLRAWIFDIAWAGPLVACTFAVFWQTKYPAIFLLFPPLIAVILRFRLAGAIFGTSLVVIVGAAFTAESHGPFAVSRVGTLMEPVMLFHIFGLMLFATCIPVGLQLKERHRLACELKEANQRLSDLALIDGLTGVQNRRSLDLLLDSEWSNGQLGDKELSLLYIDIDFFKRFNDTYGHPSGDDCLRRVARTLVASVPMPAECGGRYGGEEFVVVLPETSAGSAQATADRITASIRDLDIPHEASPFGVVTASVGIATVRPTPDANPSWLVHLADDALYAAKRSGRNRIELSAQGARGECVLT